jgi:O-6-methylguanine DNA methyltransferase
VPELRHRHIETPLGPLLAGVVEPGDTALEPGGVCLLELGDDERRARELHELESHFGASFLADTLAGGSPLLDELQAQLGGYFAGHRTDFTVPLCAPGTAFQHKVWNAMRAIQFGETTTYGRLAKQIGSPSTAARAVGAASGQNRVSILIPCHRVVDSAYDPDAGGTTGLRGYGGGIENKRRLLDHERRIAVGGGLFDSHA